MTSLPLACSVRGCGRALTRDAGCYVCPEGHSYDISRRGYINLLQPQDRRSLSAGDSRDAVQARVRLLEAGVGRVLIDAVRDVASACRVRLLPDSGGVRPEPDLAAPVVVDLGSGAGDALAAIAAHAPCRGVGIDLSADAADLAARRFPALTWIVANADRRLPLLDESVNVVLSLHARRNPDECARVLTPHGSLIVAVPAADDLLELRALVQGDATMRERGDAVVSEHAPHFGIVERVVARQQLSLDRATVIDLLATTYRGARSSEREKVDALGGMDVTCASEVLVFQKRR